MNDALAPVAAVSVKVQVVAIPEQAPLQPPKTSLVPGVSVSVTFVFWGKLAVQVPGQLIPAGVLVMIPAPAGGAVTVSWKVGVDGVEGELDPMPPQPASSRVKSATNNTQQNPCKDLMAHFSKKTAFLDEGAYRVVGCCFSPGG